MSHLRVWVDLDNAPHAPLFRPIVAALRSRGHHVAVTARRDGQTDVLAHLALDAEGVGGWRGRSLPAKVAATAVRAARLSRWLRGRTVDVAVSHGSRPLLLAALARRIPVVTMYDYEGVSAGLFHRFSRTLIVPALVPAASGDRVAARVVSYEGMKEDLYLSDFEPALDVRGELGIGRDEVLVVLRPESETAHYRARGDSAILDGILDRLGAVEGVRVVLLPRSPDQGRRLTAALERRGVPALVPAPLDGRELVRAADLVIGGGGTMTREAAALGVPAYSYFRGALGAVDRWLSDTGRLTLIRSADAVERIRLERRGEPVCPPASRPRVLEQVVDEICASARRPDPKNRT
ncbi:MAG: DUF354 domain-containing protein [Gemmatimonadota bacterium]